MRWRGLKSTVCVWFTSFNHVGHLFYLHTLWTTSLITLIWEMGKLSQTNCLILEKSFHVILTPGRLWGFRRNELRGKSHFEEHTREVLNFTVRWHQFSVQHGGEVEVQRKLWPEREPCLLWSACKEVQRDNGSVSFPVNESLTDEKGNCPLSFCHPRSTKETKDKRWFPLSILSIFEHH